MTALLLCTLAVATGFVIGVGATLWWVTRHDPLGGNAPPEEDPHKW